MSTYYSLRFEVKPGLRHPVLQRKRQRKMIKVNPKNHSRFFSKKVPPTFLREGFPVSFGFCLGHSPQKNLQEVICK